MKKARYSLFCNSKREPELVYFLTVPIYHTYSVE